ncbi:MAG: transporter substrate-binding domain-containing protein [Colwellia sp.]|nr:transporter substrate-binding domain-containing protein [Colwellia sp.]
MKVVLLVLLVFYSSIAIAVIEEKTHILWLTDDKDDEKNYLADNQLSIGTDTINLLIKEIKNYQLNFQFATIPRINLLLKSSNSTCVANRVKTKERALNNIFSLPINIYPGLRLYYIDEYSTVPQSLINQDAELSSLVELFEKRQDKVIGISKGRSFGMYLDKQISQIPKANINLRAGGGRYEALMQMLIKKRIDYIIDFPTEVKEQVDLAVLNDEMLSSPDINSIAIANSPEFIFGRIACTKTAVGEAFIVRINEILRTLYNDPAFYQAHERYINKNDLPAFKILFDQQFQKLFTE